jgi:hypothetical protein
MTSPLLLPLTRSFPSRSECHWVASRNLPRSNETDKQNKEGVVRKPISIAVMLVAVALLAFSVTSHSGASTEPMSTATGQGLRTQVPSVGGTVSQGGDATSPSILQFKAGGHLLGFQPNRAYVVGMDHALSVEFLGTPGVMPQAAGEVEQKSDRSAAPALGRVVYQNLWEGISLAYTTDQNGIAETIYEVAPGGDVSKIRWRTNVPVHLERDGSLRLQFDRGYMTESAPIAWQDIDGKRVPVQVAFRLTGSELGFTVGAYDRNHSLIIDPTYAWHTFYGSGTADDSSALAVDAGGNVYVTGVSYASWDGPASEAPLHAHSGGDNWDVFVLKLSSNGAYQWHTFYGSGIADDSSDLAVDAGGNVYITGASGATWNGPELQDPLHAYGGSNDIFVLKLNSNGAYQWHTFYGSGTLSDDGQALAVDAMGNVYVTGSSLATWSGPAPELRTPLHAHSGGDADLFVLKLYSNGAYQWHTFYGSGIADVGSDLAVDAGGSVYVTGLSSASWIGPAGNSPLHAYAGGYDLYVLKLSSSGAYQWHTFYGSTGQDEGYALAVDARGKVYVTGVSYASWDGPAGEPALHAYNSGGADFADFFVLKLNSNGTYQWHTFYGSIYDDYVGGLAVDRSGNVYVTGYSYTWAGPASEAPLHPYSGNTDVFVLKLNSSGAYQWHTFYGSTNSDIGRGLAVDARGTLYVTGYSYATWDGPELQDPLHAFSGYYDLFVVKMKDSVPGDLNDDGMPDIIWRNSATGANVVWFMDGANFLSAAQLPPVTDLNWKLVGMADFDNDGQSDILWSHNFGANVVWHMNGSNLQYASYLLTVSDTNWEAAGVADFNNDGNPDILWRNHATGATAVWYMNGTNFQGAEQLPTVTDTNWELVGIADFDLDGRLDILWSNVFTGASAVWYLNGANFRYASQLLTVDDTNWQMAGTADFDDDNHPDLIWRNTATGATVVWYMDGANFRYAAQLPTVTDTNWEIVGP